MAVAESSTTLVAGSGPVPERFSGRWFRQAAGFAAIGLILLLANFPKFLGRVIDLNVSNGATRAALHAPIDVVQAALRLLIGDNPTAFFERAMTCNFFLLLSFFVLVAAFCVRRLSIRMLAYGLVATVVGYFVVHILAWAAMLTAIIIEGVLFVTHWVSAAIAWLFLLVFSHQVFLLAVGLVIAAYLIARADFLLLRRAWAWIVGVWLYVAGFAIVAAVLFVLVPVLWKKVLIPIFHFLGQLLGPIFAFLAWIFSWLVFVLVIVAGAVFAVVMCGLLLATVGTLYISQLQAAWRASHSNRDMMVAGFAIGSALAMITVESFASPTVAYCLNQAFVNVAALLHLASVHTASTAVTDAFDMFLPSTVEAFARQHLVNQLAPAFDSLMFLSVMLLSCQSVLFRLFGERPTDDADVPLRYIASEFAKLTVGFFMLSVLYFLSILSGDASS